MVVAFALVWAGRPVSAGEPQLWERLAGSDSAIRVERTESVTDVDAWQKLWTEHTKGMADAPELPKADFTRETVVAVFLGERTQGGYAVEIETRQNPKDASELLVTYGEKKPASGWNITLMNQPFEFRKFAKTYASVKFEKPSNTSQAKGEENAKSKTAKRDSIRLAFVRIGEMKDSLSAMAPRKTASAFDGNTVRLAKVPAVMTDSVPGVTKIGLPPPPDGKKKRSLPPPPQGRGKKTLPPPPRGGKKLPPPPRGGKKLPPPPGGKKPLPPPPGRTLPRPIYPGGPLPGGSLSLRRAERTYSTYGMSYIGYWHDGTGYEAQKGTVETKESDGNVDYILSLNSPRYQYYVEFYHDRKNDRIFYTRTKKHLGSKSRRLVVSFANRAQKPLMPWEKESFTFALKNTQVSLESASGAYDYDVSYNFTANNPTRIDVTMMAGRKRLLAPDRNGIGAGLKVAGGGLKLVVTDKWAQYYAGEKWEIAYVIRWDDGKWYRRDKIISEATSRSPLSRMTRRTIEIDIPTSKRGSYYLESWSFRRADSAISTGNWIGRGKGNTVTK